MIGYSKMNGVREEVERSEVNGELVFTTKKYYDENDNLVFKAVYNKYDILIYDSFFGDY